MIHWKSACRIIGWSFVLIILIGCSLGTAAPTATQQPASTQAPTVAATEPPTNTSNTAGQCENQYYPVREGATWSYASTGGPTGPYSYTDSIGAVRPDGYTLTSQFKDLTRTQEWACKPEGLVALQLGGAALVAQKIKLQIDTQNASGVSFPTRINTGDAWDYGLDFTGKMEVAGNPGDASGNDKVHFKALGVESVTVPAGTFDAMKIQADTTLNITVNINGLSVPVVFTSSYTYWYASNVGEVKASGTGSIATQSFSETIELQSYNIP